MSTKLTKTQFAHLIRDTIKYEPGTVARYRDLARSVAPLDAKLAGLISNLADTLNSLVEHVTSRAEK